MTDSDIYLITSCFPTLGPLRFKLLIDYFNSAQKFYSAKSEKLTTLGLPVKLIDDWQKFKLTFDLKNYRAKLDKAGIKVTFPFEPAYPKLLKTLEDRPIVLYYQGPLASLNKTAIAVVGSRKMTSYGRFAAEKLVSQLSDYPVAIASGLMYGIDEVTHRTAITNKAQTIGIWAGGLDTLSGSRLKLAKDILRSDGIIATEYPLGFPPSAATFPVRNRIVSGLSKAVLVIEAAQNSGSLITASHAARQGREVLAVPGPINSLTSQGTNSLIQKGAKLAQGLSDILEELDIKPEAKTAPSALLPLDGTTQKILSLIAKTPIHIDDIARLTDLPTAKISSILTSLELSGQITNLGSGIYSLN